MTIKGLIKMLKQEVELSNQQIYFNEIKGHDDQYEKGYRDALRMVIVNLRDMEGNDEIN